jgi:hypothetical protein
VTSSQRSGTPRGKQEKKDGDRTRKKSGHRRKKFDENEREIKLVSKEVRKKL